MTPAQAVPKPPEAQTLRAPVSAGPVDRAVLEDLAAASRILVDQGVFDAAGHFSMRHPDHPERFLMSRSLAPALVQADDIMEFDLMPRLAIPAAATASSSASSTARSTGSAPTSW